MDSVSSGSDEVSENLIRYSVVTLPVRSAFEAPAAPSGSWSASDFGFWY